MVWIVVFLLLVQSIGNLYLPNLNADLINNGVAKGDLGYIWRIGAYMLAISALIIGASVIIAYFSSKVSMSFGRDVRKEVFVSV